MEQRTLGATGTLVSALCLGTMTFGDESDEATSHGMLDDFVDAGGTFIDTADVYSRGVSEEIIGRWLADRGNRDDLVIATKVRMAMGDGPNDIGLSRTHVLRGVEDSLRRLQVDHVDLLQAHAWDPLTPIEETLQAFDDLVRAGKVRYIGVSNFTGWQLQRAILLARFGGLAPIVTLQPHYNLLGRELEWELVPLCEDEGIGLLPWSPLGGGWLTGKYSRDERPTGATRLGEDPERGFEAYDKRNTERTWRILDVVEEIAKGRHVSMAQVALNWVTQQPTVTATILGARTREQLADNLGSASWSLSDDELDRLGAVSEPPTPDYPYGMIDDLTRERLGRLEG
jgi:aryl-alcohol dehydrogenase-like predicted oxidoreductase